MVDWRQLIALGVDEKLDSVLQQGEQESFSSSERPSNISPTMDLRTSRLHKRAKHTMRITAENVVFNYGFWPLLH